MEGFILVQRYQPHQKILPRTDQISGGRGRRRMYRRKCLEVRYREIIGNVGN